MSTEVSSVYSRFAKIAVSGQELTNLCAGLELEALNDAARVDPDILVSSITEDSRKVGRSQDGGSLFFAISGDNSNGEDFIPQAIERGVAAILVENSSRSEKFSSLNVPVYAAKNIREVVAIVATRFYQQPSDSLKSIAVTGTNGKTSVSWITANLLSGIGKPTALIGTLGYSLLNQQATASFQTLDNTTPSPITIHSAFCDALKKGLLIVFWK